MSGGVLQDKLALVTGAASGIGRAICQVFAREGAKIAAVDINEEGQEETRKMCDAAHHSVYIVDVTSKPEVEDLFARVRTDFGEPPSVVVNCAGIISMCSLLEMPEEMFDAMIKTNLKTVFLVTQQAGKHMVQDKISGGVFVNVASTLSKRAVLNLAHYGAAKAGVASLTRSTALELAPHGIRCNAVLPGQTVTPMTKDFPQSSRSPTVLGRNAEPPEIAEVVLFLASDRSSYMTGASVDVNGGSLM